jgi:hypothetical protein
MNNYKTPIVTMSNILYKLVAAILITVGTISCIKEDVVLENPQNYNRPLNFAAPVVNIHFGAKDLLERIDTSSFFDIDEQGLLHFRYDTTFTAEWDDLINFDDLSYSANYDISPINNVPMPFTFIDTVVANEDATQRFDSLTIKQAIMRLSLSCPPGITGRYEVTIPEILKSNGMPVVSKGVLGGEITTDEDITNGRIIFSHIPGKSFYQLVIKVYVDTPKVPPLHTNLGITSEIVDLLPKTMFGYFGQVDAFHKQEEIVIDFFNELNISEMIQLKDISMDISVENYFGVPIMLIFDSLLFTNETTGQSVDVYFNNGSNSVLVDAATYAEPIVPSTNKLSLNSENSNLVDGVNIGPTNIFLSATGKSNPEGETTENFVETSTKLNGNISIDIPLWFKTTLYARTDTMDFNFTDMIDSAQIDYLDELNLYFKFNNGFPFNIEAQAWFVDEFYHKVDSVFPVDGGELIWKSGIIDANGIVTSPSKTDVTISINHEMAKKLYDREVKFILVKSQVSTGLLGSPEFVKLLDSYAIDAGLSVEVKSGSIKYQ